MIIWSGNGQASQPWQVNANGAITGVQSGLRLDVTNSGTANGTLVQLSKCSGQAGQKWNLG